MLGACGMSLGVALWSLALLAGRPRRPAVAALGLVTGLATPAALALGAMRIDVHGLIAQMALLAAFALRAAWRLARDGRWKPRPRRHISPHSRPNRADFPCRRNPC